MCSLSGCTQDQEHMRHPGACRALTDLQRSTQGEQVPAECLSRNVILYKLKYVHKGDFTYLSRNEKKATFSFYLSPIIYNRQVTWRKGLIKKRRQLPVIGDERRSDK